MSTSPNELDALVRVLAAMVANDQDQLVAIYEHLTYPTRVLNVSRPPSGIDITANTQSAIDRAIGANKQYKEVRLPPGRWQLSDTLTLGVDGLNMSCVLSGTRPAFTAVTDEAFTILDCQFDDRPAIRCQGARAPVIEDIFFLGQNNYDAQVNDVQDLLDDDVFLLPGVTTACSAIEFDPDAGTGSSSGIVRNCAFQGFSRGIRLGTSGDAGTLNAESFLFDRLFFDHVAIPFVFGHHQTKQCVIKDCNAASGQYYLDCVQEGLGFGYPPEIRGGIAHQFQRCFNIHHTIGTFKATRFYAENTHSIGAIGAGFSTVNSSAHLDTCEFLFCGGDDTAVDAHLVCAMQLLASSCKFAHNVVTGSPRTMRVRNFQEVTFDHCNWPSRAEGDPGTFPADFHDRTLVEFRRCRYRDEASGSLKIHGDAAADDLSLGAAVVDAEAAFTIAGLGEADIQVGDIVRPATAWTPSSHYPGASLATNLSIGVVGEIDGDTATLVHVPQTILAALPLASQTLTRRRITAA